MPKGGSKTKREDTPVAYEVEELTAGERTQLVLYRKFNKLYSSNNNQREMARDLMDEELESDVFFGDEVINERQEQRLCKNDIIRLDKQKVIKKTLILANGQQILFTYINTQLQARSKSISVVHVPIGQCIPKILLIKTHILSSYHGREYIIPYPEHSDTLSDGDLVYFK